MRTNYQRGREFEYRTRKELTAMGAEYIMRAASSKGAADLIALFPKGKVCGSIHSLTASGAPLREIPLPQPWLVQCKMDGKLPKSECETLQALAEATGARAVLSFKNKNRSLAFKDIVTGEAIVRVLT